MDKNKTLADVQPGGRVRLGDQAERARFEEWYVQNAFDYEANPIGSRDCALQWKAWQAGRAPMLESMWVEIRREGDQTFPRVMERSHAEAFLRTCNVGPIPTIQPLYAALSAQPSPGGQGDALTALVAKWRAAAADHELNGLEADSIGLTVAAMRNDARHHVLEAAADELEAALAARQPVGEPDAWVPDKFFGPGVNAMTARRKPSDAAIAAHGLYVPLYRHPAPPAKAVDLGRIRSTVQALLNWIDDWAETPEESGIDAIEIEAAAVLDLIDGNA